MRINRIEIIKEDDIRKDILKVPKPCFASDLARLTGIEYDLATGCGLYWIDPLPTQEKVKRNKTDKTQEFKTFYKMRAIKSNGNFAAQIGNNSIAGGIRITIPFDAIDNFDLGKIDELNFEYPLFAISDVFRNTLESLIEQRSSLIMKTGRSYDINGILYPELEILGTRFIRFPIRNLDKTLSDGSKVETSTDHVFLAISKIPFIVDEKNKLLVSDIIIMGTKYSERACPFKDSNLKQYLNGKFLSSLNDELQHSEPGLLFTPNQEDKKNRYHFNFDSMSEEDILEVCIKSNIAVFLHGQTGVGKTERVLSLDKDLELVDFGCTSSDGFTGIIAKDFNSQELVLYEPYWYKSLCKKCKEKPDKIHILFLDELPNAKGDVPKVAFEVALNKMLTNSGFRLKLPENAVVCAAGNDHKESKVANVLSAPLFGRFAHIYIETDSNAWLRWASKRKKENRELAYESTSIQDQIHPAIIDYIKAYGDNALRTPFNGKTPNADPRKWALASKALYSSNNPNVLRAFIGREMTDDFIKFSKMDLITVDDVLNNRCTPDEFPQDPSIKAFTIKVLSTVDEENVDKVRDFIGKLGHEYLSLFDYEWSKNSDERVMMLLAKSDRQLVMRMYANGNNRGI